MKTVLSSALLGFAAASEDGNLKLLRPVEEEQAAEEDFTPTSADHAAWQMFKKYVGTNGPLSVCVNAGSWHSYQSGVMTNCPSRDTDHCVQIVGYGKTSLEYWKVRNSWGTNFGEKGFLRIALGSNQCAITSEPTKTTPGHVIGTPMRVQDDVQASSVVV